MILVVVIIIKASPTKKKGPDTNANKKCATMNFPSFHKAYQSDKD